jgi:hypothetical protein
MRSLLKYLLFTAMTVLFSCDKTILFVNCPDCTKEDPITAVLEIKVDQSALRNYLTVLIRVYSGYLEDDILIEAYPVTAMAMTYIATINKRYTITATYFTSDATYTAVDSTIPRVRYEKDLCSEPCYYVYDNKINLKLKYTK